MAEGGELTPVPYPVNPSIPRERGRSVAAVPKRARMPQSRSPLPGVVVGDERGTGEVSGCPPPRRNLEHGAPTGPVNWSTPLAGRFRPSSHPRREALAPRCAARVGGSLQRARTFDSGGPGGRFVRETDRHAMPSCPVPRRPLPGARIVGTTTSADTARASDMAWRPDARRGAAVVAGRDPSMSGSGGGECQLPANSSLTLKGRSHTSGTTGSRVSACNLRAQKDNSPYPAFARVREELGANLLLAEGRGGRLSGAGRRRAAARGKCHFWARGGLPELIRGEKSASWPRSRRGF